MRETYKNKRDFYRGEMERYRRQVGDLQEKLKQTNAPKKQERYSAKTYCTSCHVVVKYDIVMNVRVTDCTCHHCGEKALSPVAKDYSNPFD